MALTVRRASDIVSSCFPTFRSGSFLVLAGFVRGGGRCQGSTVVDRVAALALTVTTIPFTTIAAEEGSGSGVT